MSQDRECCFHHRVDHSKHRTIRPAQRAVRKGKKRLFKLARAIDPKRVVLDEGGFTGEGAFGDGPDFRPGLGPNLRKRLAQSIGLGTQDRAESIVVDRDQIGSPDHGGGETVVQRRRNGKLKLGRPDFNGSQWRSRPIMSSHPMRHLAVAKGPVQVLFHS